MAYSKRTAALTAALTVAAGGFVPGMATANAADVNSAPAGSTTSTSSNVVIGPGSPLRMPVLSNEVIEGRHVGAPMCSLGVPGTIVDENGVPHRVILTAGHCVMTDGEMTGEASTGEFFIPTKDGDKLVNKDIIGSDFLPDEGDVENSRSIAEGLNYVFNSADYGIIEVQDDIQTTSLSQSVDEFGGGQGEPVQIVGIEDKRTLEPMEVSFDNLGEPVCTDGSRTGRGCGYQIFRVRNGIWAISPIDNGDSGGNAYNPETREAIGVNSMGIGPLSRFQPVDVALEEQYGIPDGEVNDYFQVETSTEPQSEFRTIDQDSKFAEEHMAPPTFDEIIGELLPEEVGSLIPDLPSPSLPSADTVASQASLPSLF